jgi:3-dehydroquinate dehydratase-2
VELKWGIAISEAVSSINIPAVEVHISNIFNREVFRHHSYLSSEFAGTITGFGYLSYL